MLDKKRSPSAFCDNAPCLRAGASDPNGAGVPAVKSTVFIIQTYLDVVFLAYSPRGPGGNFSFKYRVSNSYKCRVVPGPS